MKQFKKIIKEEYEKKFGYQKYEKSPLMGTFEGVVINAMNRVKLLTIPVVICSAEDIKDKISDSLNYYNVDGEDLDEMLEDVDSSDLSDIMNAITTLNTLLFKCES